MPLRRLGPHPLPLYLAAASRSSANGEQHPDTTFAAFIAGLKAYWRQPHTRPALSGEPVWRQGAARLIASGPPGGLPVLLVPSLVNRAYILDLLPERSLVQALAGAGHRVLLLDWGEPGRRELDLGIADHLAEHLEPAFRVAGEGTARKPVLLGYCMGGLLALALATRVRRAAAGLGLLATPWDFAQAGLRQPLPPQSAVAMLAGTLATYGHVPANMLDWVFGTLDPAQVVAKYAAFGRGDPASQRSRSFVAIEDWLADGVALAGPVATECLLDWYIANRPAAGSWTVGGSPVRPDAVEVPAFVALPSRDRIVPKRSARPLARLLPRATVIEPPAGHVGMIVGGEAPRILWRPLLRWLGRIADATV